MKKAAVLLFTFATIPVYAQGLLGSLNKYQESLQPKVEEKPGSKPVPEVKATKIASTSASAKCEENDQTSLPLSYVTSLITEPDGKLNLQHDSRAGTLTVSSPEMIGNCSSMIEWTLKQPEIQGQKAYAIEAKIKQGENCTPEAGCTYKVAKVKDGAFDKFEDVVLKPTLKGFEECLQKSGVIVDNKVVPGAIYSSPLNEKLSGIDQSGKLLFVSHGPSSALVKAKYGKYEPIDRCDYYEKAHPDVVSLLTFEDQERARLDAEAAKLMDCPINEYHKVADFIDKYEAYSSQLGQVRDRLILETAKKSAAAIASGKYTDEDLKVLADFEKYIMQPKIDLAVALYEGIQDSDPEQRPALEARLKEVLAEIATLGKAPYFTAAHTKKLFDDGKFDEAQQMNSLLLTLGGYSQLGRNVKGVITTPTAIHNAIAKARFEFSENLEKERKYHAIRTGQAPGESENLLAEAKILNGFIQQRTANYTQNIQDLAMDIQQPNGHCFKYWVNTQRCYQETVEDIQMLQQQLQKFNQVDLERIKKLQSEAEMYKKLEAEGERYLAGESGEPTNTDPNNLRPARADRRETLDTSNANLMAKNGQLTQEQQMMLMQQQAQQQAQMTPQNFMYNTNPYANQNGFQGGYNLGQYAQYANGNGMFGQQQFGQQQYGQNFLGQQAYGYGNNNGFGGNFGFQGSFNLGLGGNYGYNPYQQNMMGSNFGYNPYQQNMMGNNYGYNLMGYQGYPQYGLYQR